MCLPEESELCLFFLKHKLRWTFYSVIECCQQLFGQKIPTLQHSLATNIQRIRVQKNKTPHRSQSFEGHLSAKPVLITMEALFVFQTKHKPDWLIDQSRCTCCRKLSFDCIILFSFCTDDNYILLCLFIFNVSWPDQECCCRHQTWVPFSMILYFLCISTCMAINIYSS